MEVDDGGNPWSRFTERARDRARNCFGGAPARAPAPGGQTTQEMREEMFHVMQAMGAAVINTNQTIGYIANNMQPQGGGLLLYLRR